MATLKVGDLVWAKMKGFPPWPGKIVNEHTGQIKKNLHYVFFYGTKNYAWISFDNITLHNQELIDQYYNTQKRNAAFRTAVDAIVNASKGNPKYMKTVGSSSKNLEPKKDGTATKSIKEETFPEEKPLCKGADNTDNLSSVSKTVKIKKEISDENTLIIKKNSKKRSHSNEPVCKRKKNSKHTRLSVPAAKVENIKSIFTSENVVIKKEVPDEKTLEGLNNNSTRSNGASKSKFKRRKVVSKTQLAVPVKTEQKDKSFVSKVEVIKKAPIFNKAAKKIEILKKPLRKRVAKKSLSVSHKIDAIESQKQRKVNKYPNLVSVPTTKTKKFNSVRDYKKMSLKRKAYFTTLAVRKFPSICYKGAAVNINQKKMIKRVPAAKTLKSFAKKVEIKKKIAGKKKPLCAIKHSKKCLSSNDIANKWRKGNKNSSVVVTLRTEVKKSVLKKNQGKDITNLSNFPPTPNYFSPVPHTSSADPEIFHMMPGTSTQRDILPDIVPLDSENVNLTRKLINATSKKIGFLGLGSMGQGMVRNLIQSGHSVTLWNRTSISEKFAGHKYLTPKHFEGIIEVSTPADVIKSCDITFCCVSDEDASKTLVFGKNGVLSGLQKSSSKAKGSTHWKKGYVELTSISPETSIIIADKINLKGGRYLEAQMSGTTEDAQRGSLTILGAGDESLFNDSETCIRAMANNSLFLTDEVGVACKYTIVHNMLLGTIFATAAEFPALVDRIGLEQSDFRFILRTGALFTPVRVGQEKAMIDEVYTLNKTDTSKEDEVQIEDYTTGNIPLKHIKKNFKFALELGSKVDKSTPITAAANEFYKNF